MLKTIMMLGLLFVSAICAAAQTTEFTYQGNLKIGAPSNTVPATGNYDFEFRLFDADTNGNQLGLTLTRNIVPTDNGSFSVKLDFGAQFPGANRYLAISVRPSGNGTFTPLSPRQQLSNAPYSVRSMNAGNADTATNALQLGGVAADQFVVTTDPRMSNARSPISGSDNYIQNGTSQQGGNFNISGNGTANGTLSGNALNTATQINIAGQRFVSKPGSLNTFVGINAGQNQNLGTILGIRNTYFGFDAGKNNVEGDSNAFFGGSAGRDNTGFGNTAIGDNAGSNVPTGTLNTYIGSNTTASLGLDHATAIGAFARVTKSNSIVLGATGGSFNADVGIGTTAPATKLHIADNGGNIFFGGGGCNAGLNGIGFGNSLTCSNYALLGNTIDTLINRPAGGSIIFREDNATQMRIEPGGAVSIGVLGPAGSTTLCRNASNQISTCSSSIRYKNNINSFSSGLDLLRRLRPVSFNWNDGGMRDLGLVAEEVAAVEPLLVTQNNKGEVEGVKYDRVGVVLINAVKEQQAQIAALTKIVCSLKPDEALCKEKEK